ncbi:MAG: hypothetical protein J7639_08660 [Paenibacillaceae bacterium]|nr:hypothetical protein [Paenibacillaceae bacterium]
MNRKEEAVSRSFELRYVTDNPAANGETDFKGPTAVFDTEERVNYLRQYAKHARKFFGNDGWDRPVVADAEVEAAHAAIKPQPLPAVRRRIPLEHWKWAGGDETKLAARSAAQRQWVVPGATELSGDTLIWLAEGATVRRTFVPQRWRFMVYWTFEAGPNATSLAAGIRLQDSLEIGFAANGRSYCFAGGDRIECGDTVAPGERCEVKLEADLSCSRMNVYVNGRLVVDFAETVFPAVIDTVDVFGSAGMRLVSIRGTGFAPHELAEDGIHGGDAPFTIGTFLDESFAPVADIRGWTGAGCDERGWLPAMLPFAYGGERYAGEDLYLRTEVTVAAFERAYLQLECLDPGGELWINGRVVSARFNRYPERLDVTAFLRPDVPNIIAVRVFPNTVDTKMRHTSSDRHTGWFAGRMTLDLTDAMHVEDVFVYTRSIHEDMAVLQAEVTVRNDRRVRTSSEALNSLQFRGSMDISLYEWFPGERETPSAVASFPVAIGMGQSLLLSEAVRLPMPALWSAERPFLYRIRVVLRDADGLALDDYAITTGVRTVSQEGGVFRVNGKADMMNGALLFGFRHPIENIARWDRCSPAEWIVRDLLMLRKLNGNSARMSQHNGMIGGINDPRYAEIGDQLGIMFQWATSAWLRDASPWLLDLKGLPLYVREVRNHPSIVMWQPSNHPSFESFDAGMPWYEEVYQTIYREDPSRLISPTANLVRLQCRNDAGTLDHEGRRVHPVAAWTAPGITRGGMDYTIGYGAEWSVLRSWPRPPQWEGEDNWRHEGYKSDFLASAERAYFDFENEESIAQPNWRLLQGKPEYRIKSYEWDYERGSIGRELELEEWELSQAYQAFSAYESIRKKRWLGYDGFAWCTLRGGGNNGTYMKPISDYYGHGKMAFYTVAMAYQKLLAGSGDVDLVYGPDDAIRPVVINTGGRFRGSLVVSVYGAKGALLEAKRYEGLDIPPGKTVRSLAPFRPAAAGNAAVFVHYELYRDARADGGDG